MSLKSWRDIPPGGIIVQAGNSKANKTGTWSGQHPTVDADKCTKCQLCVQACPENCIYADKTKNIQINDDYCKGCGICAQACPQQAIKPK